ncbi:AMP-binding protein [Vibrio sp. 10N.261.55.A7]|uniref:AMP-binding protein n=1 Tax=Vibrio sp. 10N.261.55.A7 TaxID=1880851 RepID=UPI000C816A1D|nr:AMP-binding protein [Vibrio sp. 10N.261.55.A7]PMJ92955.1 AMP-fatty acid ligase [Vibrio sp. 10N.261.55.A7]
MSNHTATQFSSLSEIMNAARADSHPVSFSEQGTWTWQQFKSDIATLVSQLRGIQQQHIALCSNDTYLFAIGFFALSQTNKTIVLPGNYQPNALIELASQYELLLCDPVIAASISAAENKHNIDGSVEMMLLVSSSSDQSNRLDSDQRESHQRESSQCESTPTFETLDLDAQQIILYTSGSSGQPKAITKTMAQLNAEVAVLERQWGKHLQGTTIESTVSHQHIYGLLFKLLWPLCVGRAFNKMTLEYPEQLLTHCDKDTLLISSPALLKRLTGQMPGAYRMIFSSGGPLPFQAAQESKQWLGQLPTEVFGSTETGGIAFRQQANDTSPWQLFPSIEAGLNAEHCLKLKSPYIDPSRWYQTADQVELLGEGLFNLKGRADRIVKIEEKRISLVEVEKRLEQLPWIEESAVIPMYDDERLTLVAAIALTPLGEEKIRNLGKGKFWLALRAELRQWLEPIATPKRFRVVNEIPLSSQGKRLTTNIEQLFEK